tara:strand:- start:267 stop:419 length:153 start_codon:yes stop_codon:yes gene_type:complete
MYDIPELQLMRHALDVITIKGSDAKLLAKLQSKIENELDLKSKPKPAKRK